MWRPSGGVHSVIAWPGRGMSQAATELEKMKWGILWCRHASSTLRSPVTFVRQYSFSPSPVKS